MCNVITSHAASRIEPNRKAIAQKFLQMDDKHG